MPFDDAWGTIEGGCGCGGDLRYFHFGADCRGNPPSSGIHCETCGRSEERIPEAIREYVRSGKPVKGKKGDV